MGERYLRVVEGEYLDFGEGDEVDGGAAGVLGLRHGGGFAVVLTMDFSFLSRYPEGFGFSGGARFGVYLRRGGPTARPHSLHLGKVPPGTADTNFSGIRRPER